MDSSSKHSQTRESGVLAPAPSIECYTSPSVVQDFNTKYLAATMAVVLIIEPLFLGPLLFRTPKNIVYTPWTHSRD